jgi:UDP-2,3-diacylglucosamine pyrophosphatase LpxH
MECKAYKFKETRIELIPIGDVHMGDKAFTAESLEKLKGYIDYIKNHSSAYCFLMGDLCNCATLDSKSSPFAQNMDVNQQIKEIVKILSPIKKKILGAIDGNHELRLERYCGYSPTISICERLDVPYFKNSAVIIFRLCCHGTRDVSRAAFVGYFHHTTGGSGNSMGGKINRPEKLKGIIGNCDFYCGAHNHSMITGHTIVFKVNETTEKIEQLRQIILTTGGYLQFNDSYVEEKMLSPMKIGSPRISLIVKRHDDENGKDAPQKDIHVSL